MKCDAPCLETDMSLIFERAAVLLCALALTACATLPSLQSLPQIKPAGDYESRQSFEAPPGEWPQSAWWQGYGDPQLDALIEEALTRSPSIATAEARLRRAQATVQTTRSALAPQLSGNSSAT